MRRFALLLFSLTALSAQPIPETFFAEMKWRMIGPFRGGRTPSVVGVPSQPNVFYMGVNDGGVWKSTDFGATWQPIFDDQPTGSIGVVAVAPSDPNIIYVGSGEGLQRPDLSTGDGIYKSTDAGKTWTHLGLRDGQQIGGIAIDPRDPNRVFAAVLGHPYGPNEERGVFRSTDGGATWNKVLYNDQNTGARDVMFDPSNPRKVYAVMWAARQYPWEASANGPGSGIFVSNDGGSDWRQLILGLPTFEDGLGPMSIGISPSNPRRMYARVEATREGGFYRSDDGGENWQRVSNEARVIGRGGDTSSIKVDPRNPNVVYVANTSTYKSTDGGETFTAIKGAPGGDDYQSIWINPNNPEIIALGVDQGATISVNGGKTWSSWYNQPTAQFYHVITDNRFPYWVYGGQQESGSIAIASRSDYGEITFRDWHPVGVEEYGYVAPDPLDPNMVYGGKATRYNQTTGDVQNIAPVAGRGGGKYRSVRTMPLIFSTVDPHVLFLAGNVLFKTINGGHSWTVISPDLTRETYEMPASMGIFAQYDPEKGKHRGVIYAIAPSRKDINTIWVGTDDGLIHITRDGGRSWKNITPPDLTAWSKVSQLDASYFDNETVYAAINRFRLDDLHPHIYRTHDGGKTWKQTVDGIPDNEAVNTVREDPVRKGLLYAGTERAVYVSFNDGDHWQSLRQNMPATSIRDLVIHGDDLVIGTHGRSFWILDDVTPLRQLKPEFTTGLFQPRVAYRMARDRNTDTPLTPEVPAGQNPPDGAILDYYLSAAPASPVTLEVFDHLGKSVRTYSSDDKPEAVNPNELNVPTYWVRMPKALPAEAGMHRWVWDLRLRPPDALAHTYPISAIYHDTPRYPLGPWVMPGAYTIKLTVDGKTYTQMLTVKMDPRNKTGVTGLMEQYTLATKVWSAMNEDYAAIQQIRKVRAELSQRRENGAAVANGIADLDQKLAAIEGAGGGGRGRGGAAGGDTLSRLNAELSQILEIVAESDQTPTVQAAAAVAELRKSLDGKLAKWNATKSKDIPALNAELKKAGLGAIEP
ncbi:MAG TPA: hypothetical protein VK419_11995 [Bryobacteraceae bacterium]|nr:hypothetical protein [Bryobacteraceae bacterium]